MIMLFFGFRKNKRRDDLNTFLDRFFDQCGIETFLGFEVGGYFEKRIVPSTIEKVSSTKYDVTTHSKNGEIRKRPT
jgi:hypothetical protein